MMKLPEGTDYYRGVKYDFKVSEEDGKFGGEVWVMWQNQNGGQQDILSSLPSIYETPEAARDALIAHAEKCIDAKLKDLSEGGISG